MRWGRKKSTPLSSSSSSSSSPLLDRIFPLSWFSKSKKKKVGCRSDQTKNIQTEFLKIPTGGRRFNYSMDEDDFFWRLSFGDDHHHHHHKIIQGRKSTGGINPLWSNDTEEEERKNFNDMVSEIQKLRRGKQTVDEVVRPHSRTRNGKHRKTTSAVEQMELQDFQVRSKPQELKIAGAKKKKEEKVLEGMDSRATTAFDSFAVVKSSYNPQKDFRQSMMEMIRERGIENAEDLEELLTCYLTLNCDEYHDLIIKVFRQVWFDLNGAYHHYDRFN